MSTQPHLVDDEAVADALRIFLEHERFSRSDAMRKVLIWARQHFGSPRSTTGLAFGTYIASGRGGSGAGGSGDSGVGGGGGSGGDGWVSVRVPIYPIG